MTSRRSLVAVSLALALLAVAVLVAACGGETTTTTTNQAVTTTDASTTTTQAPTTTTQAPTTTTQAPTTTTQAVIAPPTASRSPDSLAKPPESVLVIGNSTVFLFDGLAMNLQRLAASLDPPRLVEAVGVYQSGGHLKAFYDNGAMQEAIRAGGHDVVVLQEDLPMYGVITGGATPYAFYEYGRLFDQDIRAAGGQTVLFMAYPYKHNDYFPTMESIAQMHRDLGSELKAPVAPLGLAFARAQKERPELILLYEDAEHPNQAGAYLEACVLYATLFGESCEGATWAIEKVSKKDATFLQRVAWETVQDWQQQ